MTENIENLNSSNEETTDIEEVDSNDATAVKEQNTRLVEQNRKLFARAKKAEGFELKEGKWVKPQSETKPEAIIEKKSGELDYGQLAYLEVKGITSDEDLSLVQEIMEETGKGLKDVMNLKSFQRELQIRKEDREARKAMPTGTKRSATLTHDTVDYWLAKGEMPPKGETALRRAYIEAKYQKEKNFSKFN